MPPRHGVVAVGRFSDPQLCGEACADVKGKSRACENNDDDGLRVESSRRSSGSSSKWLAGCWELGYGWKEELGDSRPEIGVRTY
jgi:hypothetical protein